MPTRNVRVIGQAAGQVIVNSMHVTSVGGSDLDIAQDFRDAWAARILPVLHASYTFQGVEVRSIDGDAIPTYAGTTSVQKGAVLFGALPTWSCVSVQLFTGTGGRAGRGRVGLGPISEVTSDNDDGNRVAAAELPKFTTAWGNLVTDLASSGGDSAMSLAVVSRVSKGVERAAPLISGVTSYKVNPILGSRLTRHPNR